MTTAYPLQLETPRLILNFADPSNDEDCLSIIKIYNDEHASRGGQARLAVNTIADVRAKHKTYAAIPALCTKVTTPPERMYHLICLKNNPTEVIGFVGMSFRPEIQMPDIGYALLKPYWNQGYASEAGIAVKNFWKDEIGVEKMWIGTLAGNRKSGRVAEKLGFVFGGQMDIAFGSHGEAVDVVRGDAYVLPGMHWKEYKEDGSRITFYPTVGKETEKQRKDKLSVDYSDVAK